MIVLTDRQRHIIARALPGEIAAQIADRIEGQRLTATEIDEVVDALSREFHRHGIDEAFEATSHGQQTERLIDIVNAPRLRDAPLASAAAIPIGRVCRGGWRAACPRGHELRATVLKSWGAVWYARYDCMGTLVAISDDAETDRSAAAVAALLGKHGRAGVLAEHLGSSPRCPVCREALRFEPSAAGGAALWIEGQLLVDVLQARVTRLDRVDNTEKT